jgi:DNA-binding Xre family transcriptional regulator
MAMRNKLKEFLSSRELSVYRFERETGLAHRTAHDLVANPETIPGSKALTKICETYKVQPGEIIEWVEG